MTLRKVRRIKNLLLVSIAIVMIILIVVSMAHKGMSASPLFLPFPAILFTVLMAGMLMTFVAIVFNAVEIFTADTPSQRFLSAQHGFKVSLWTGVIVLVLVIIFVLLIPWVETAVSTDERDDLDTTQVRTHTFELRDQFDATSVTDMVIENEGDTTIDYVIKAKDPSTSRFNEKDSGQVLGGDTEVIDLSEWPMGEYRTELSVEDSPSGGTTTFHYQIKRDLNPEIDIALTGFLGVIAVANIVWCVIAFVLMRRYEVESVGGLATMMPSDGEMY